MNPTARKEELLTQHVGHEAIVYDERTHTAHRLNATAATVMRAADGSHSIADIAALLGPAVEAADGEALVRVALAELDRAGLLAAAMADVSREDAMTRRQMLSAAAAAMIPIVTSIIAPTPLMAQSPGRTSTTTSQPSTSTSSAPSTSTTSAASTTTSAGSTTTSSSPSTTTSAPTSTTKNFNANATLQSQTGNCLWNPTFLALLIVEVLSNGFIGIRLMENNVTRNYAFSPLGSNGSFDLTAITQFANGCSDTSRLQGTLQGSPTNPTGITATETNTLSVCCAGTGVYNMTGTPA